MSRSLPVKVLLTVTRSSKIKSQGLPGAIGIDSAKPWIFCTFVCLSFCQSYWRRSCCHWVTLTYSIYVHILRNERQNYNMSYSNSFTKTKWNKTKNLLPQYLLVYSVHNVNKLNFGKNGFAYSGHNPGLFWLLCCIFNENQVYQCRYFNLQLNQNANIDLINFIRLTEIYSIVSFEINFT